MRLDFPVLSSPQTHMRTNEGVLVAGIIVTFEGGKEDIPVVILDRRAARLFYSSAILLRI